MQEFLVLLLFIAIGLGACGCIAIIAAIVTYKRQQRTDAAADARVGDGGENLDVLLQNYRTLIEEQKDDRQKLTAALMQRKIDFELKTRRQMKALKELREERQKHHKGYSESDDSHSSGIGSNSNSYWNSQTNSRRPPVREENWSEQVAWLTEKLRNYPKISRNRWEVTPIEVSRIIKERTDHHAKVQTLAENFLGADYDPRGSETEHDELYQVGKSMK